MVESDDELIADAPPPRKTKKKSVESEDEITTDAPAPRKQKKKAQTRPTKPKSAPTTVDQPVKPGTAPKVAEQPAKPKATAKVAEQAAKPTAAPKASEQPAKSKATPKVAVPSDDEIAPPTEEEVELKETTVDEAVDTPPQSAIYKQAPLPAPVPEPEVDGDTVSRAEYEKLRTAIKEMEERYEFLKQRGVKDAEASFAQYKSTAEARIEACEVHNEELQREVNTLREELRAGIVVQQELKTQLKEAKEETRDARAMVPEQNTEENSTQGQGDDEQGGQAAIEVLEAEHEKKIEELETTIEGLSKEKDELSAEVEILRSKGKQDKKHIASLTEKVSAHANQIQRLQHSDEYLITVERMVRLYEDLTGVTIQTAKDVQRSGDSDSDAEDNTMIWFKCKHMGRNGVLDYNLYTPLDVTSAATGPCTYECEPVSRHTKDGTTDLPDFLPGPITFERKMCGMFFWRACNFLNKVE
ncbi:hypothetical protein DFJ77DRAFT_161725 [Powellomyces hirtus]|nr:hypothetical protein DFJ77DRAFT_161725 [Powellomyces hirtus]